MVIELVLVYCGVLLHYIFPFFSLRFTGQEIYFVDNQDFLWLNWLFLGYIPYALYTHHEQANMDKPSRVQRWITAWKTKCFTTDFWFILRVYSLKLLYIPLMYLAAVHYGMFIFTFLLDFNLSEVAKMDVVPIINQVVYPVGVWLAMWLALVVYLFGYIIESHRFNNTIQSIDNTWFGWGITLICYVPFYPFFAYFLPNGAQDFAFYKNEEITALVRVVLLLILFIKTLAIFNLGLKSSNLTYRGIVTHGVYRYIRHPHYLTKLMLWWIGLIPSAWHYPWLVGPLFFWTMVYYWRARTEEAHLLRCDPSYKVYMEKVKYRFIPGVV